ncbi:hypothetical protein KKB99_00195 [bacterium]|nr:hypothetical protein [bacterium]MBU1024404.1 hypothetical protein [bacterium]
MNSQFIYFLNRQKIMRISNQYVIRVNSRIQNLHDPEVHSNFRYFFNHIRGECVGFNEIDMSL